MNEEKRKILTNAFENIDKRESEVKSLIEDLDKIIEAYTNLKEEFEHDDVNIFSNDEIRDLFAIIRSHERCITETKELIELFNEQKNRVTNARNFTLGIADISEFRKLVGVIKTNITNKTYEDLTGLAGSARVPFPFGRKDISKINDVSNSVGSITDCRLFKCKSEAFKSSSEIRHFITSNTRRQRTTNGDNN